MQQNTVQVPELLHLCGRLWRSSWLLALDQTNSGCYRHMESEPIDGRCLYLSVTLPWKQINLKKKSSLTSGLIYFCGNDQWEPNKLIDNTWKKNECWSYAQYVKLLPETPAYRMSAVLIPVALSGSAPGRAANTWSPSLWETSLKI